VNVSEHTEPKKITRHDCILFHTFLRFYQERFTRFLCYLTYCWRPLFQNSNILNVIPSRRTMATTTTTITATHSSIFPIDKLYSIHGFEACIFFYCHPKNVSREQTTTTTYTHTQTHTEQGTSINSIFNRPLPRVYYTRVV